jgi:hypothetical protein
MLLSEEKEKVNFFLMKINLNMFTIFTANEGISQRRKRRREVTVGKYRKKKEREKNIKNNEKNKI